MLSRLVLGFAVAVVFAVLPYFGPMLAIANFANANCRPNEGGVGACIIFGGYVGGPYLMGWEVCGDVARLSGPCSPPRP
jgi:hypothetical protein